MPVDRRENLIPQSERTKEEQREIASMGGHASVKARREKKVISNIYMEWLNKKNKLGLTGQEAIQAAISIGLDKSPAAMLKEMREALEGNTVIVEKSPDPLDDYTDEELKAAMDELKSRKSPSNGEADSESTESKTST